MPQIKTYKFDEFKIEIVNPSVNIVQVIDNYDGTGQVEIKLSIGAGQNPSANFGILLNGFTYSNHWTREEVQAWLDQKLTEYEV